MPSDMDEGISDQEKQRIVSDFITAAPPGEFNEVFNDCRILLNNDAVLQEACSTAVAQYNKDQLTPVTLESDTKCLITEYNELSSSGSTARFYDPQSKQTFTFDHLRRATSDVESGLPAEVTGDVTSGAWREAIHTAFSAYMLDHYRSGTCSVYDKSDSDNITIVACLEDHRFESKNYWNGRWRSVWSVSMPRSAAKGESGDRVPKADVSGMLRVQVHYYEDGNVQLVSNKEAKDVIDVTNPSETAKEFVRVVEEAENAYQTAIGENYQAMSDSTFKALRRQLPLTRTKIDWAKILTYRIVTEINKH